MMRAYKVVSLAILLASLLSCDPSAKHDQAVLLQVAEDPTVALKVWFKVGSQDDPQGKEGLAYLTGQMISEASTANNSYEQILQKLYPLAAGYGVQVDREMTVLSGRTHRDNLDAYFTLFTDAYLRPAFTEEDFDRLRTDALNYLKNTLRYAQVEELGKAALYGFVFEGTRYAHPPVGTVQGLESITLEDVKAFYQSHYTRDNVVLALGGGYDKALVQRLRETAGELPEGVPAVVAAPQPPSIESHQLLLVDKPDADASISVGFPIDLHRGAREFYALWLANSWLGEHRNSSSHLYQVIRESRGMNYGDYSYIEAFPQGGFRSFPPTHVGRRQQIFEIWIRTLPDEQAHFALRAALRELKLLVDNGLTEEQFELTRAFLRKYVLHFADTTSARLGYAVDDRFYGISGEGHLARFREVMDELTLEEVNAAIRKHLQYDNLKIAIVTGSAEKLKEALATNAPSPMDYGDVAKGPEILEADKEIAGFPLAIQKEAVRVVAVDQIFER